MKFVKEDFTESLEIKFGKPQEKSVDETFKTIGLVFRISMNKRERLKIITKDSNEIKV